MLINLSTIDFSSVSSGSSLNIQEEKTVDMLLTDNSIDILPDTGFDGMAKVIVSHAPVKETVEQTITTNGSHVITPDTGYDAMIQCVVDVNVSGEIDFSSIGYTPEMTKEINDKINSDIVYSEQLLARYSDTNRYDYNVKLVYAPLFPTQNRTDFKNMFNGCSSLTSIPALDTANGTNFNHMFYGCSFLTILSPLDTAKGTDFGWMFSSCSLLTSIPALDTANGTNFESMFNGCSLLTSIPALDTANGTNFKNMFYNCYNLTILSPLDVSKGNFFRNMFNNCYKLTTVPQLDTLNGTNFSYMFANCYDLTTISQLNLSNGTDFSYMFQLCKKLINITLNGSINIGIDFGYCTELSFDSIKSILTACSKTTNTNSKTVSFKKTIQDQNNELPNLVASCTEKGWQITGLTITQ